jgi:hypothetical protein
LPDPGADDDEGDEDDRDGGDSAEGDAEEAVDVVAQHEAVRDQVQAQLVAARQGMQEVLQKLGPGQASHRC